MNNEDSLYWRAVCLITEQLTDHQSSVDSRINSVYQVLQSYEQHLTEEVYSKLFNESKKQIAQLIKFERDID